MRGESVFVALFLCFVSPIPGKRVNVNTSCLIGTTQKIKH